MMHQMPQQQMPTPNQVLTYSVYYKHFTQVRWRKIKKVYSDGIFPKKDMPHRWFLTIKNVRHEIPTDGVLFKFSGNRELGIRQVKQQQNMANLAKAHAEQKARSRKPPPMSEQSFPIVPNQPPVNLKGDKEPVPGVLE